jgi:DNA invertase Pin-like site-specific DNA recombinase
MEMDVAHYYSDASQWQEQEGVVYYRESTDKQGESGLGIEAQQHDVLMFAQRYKIRIVKEYTEIISTRRKRRPQLEEALQYARENKTVLIIAVLDRLARSVAFISALMESKVRFIIADRPYATRFELHISAATAEDERRRTSTRTIKSLAAAKRRGVQLGQYGRNVLSKRNAAAAAVYARKMRPIISQLQAEGFNTVRALTDQLRDNKIPTFRKEGQWHVTTVQRLLQRLKVSPAESLP